MSTTTTPTPVTTTLRSALGFYLCAEGGGGGVVMADRLEAGPWETWTVTTHDDGTVSLQAADGRYLCAELDGSVVADRAEAGPWETFAIEVRDVGVAFKGAHGRYLCADLGGGPGVRVTCDRPRPDQDPATVPGAWEFFAASTPFWDPVIPATPNRLTGVLTRQGRVIGDASGPRILMFCHAMELFSAWCHGREADVIAQCEIIAAHYAGVRVCDVLGYHDQNRPGEDPWVAWAGREVTPIGFEAFSGRYIDPTPDYYDRLGAFLEMLHELGLRIFHDRGDLNAWTDDQKCAHLKALGELYASLPCGPEVLGGLFACNEGWQNGCDNITLAGQMLEAFTASAGWVPALCGFTAPGGSSDPEALAACDPPMATWEPEMPDSFKHWSQDPATVITCHGNRGDHTHIIEHYFGYGYDTAIRGTNKPVINTEPVGGGEGVSVGRVDDPELLCGLTVAALLGGQAWTFMSGHGVFWNGPIETMPGFLEVARLPSFLPADIAAWPTVCHSGTRFAGTRILAVIDPTRADQAIAEDGRFVIVVHTQEAAGAALPCERACTEFTVINMVTGQVERTGPLAIGETYQHPGVARLVVGQLAAAPVTTTTKKTIRRKRT